MKKLLCLLIILFVVGCIAQPLTETEPDQKVEMGEETSNVVEGGEVSEDTFTVNVGGEVTVDDRKVVVKELTFDYELIIYVSGEERVIYGTKSPEIMQGLKLEVLEVHFDPEGQDSYVVLKVNKFELGENEYLMHIDDEVRIDDEHKVILRDVKEDQFKKITVRVGRDSAVDIKIGETEDVGGVFVTNLDPHPRAISSEKYAVIKAVLA